jgi:hypothetical protein
MQNICICHLFCLSIEFIVYTWCLGASCTVTLIVFWTNISVCHLWHWCRFGLVHYYVTEHQCTVVLQFILSLLLCFTTHKCCMPLLRADLPELTNSTQIYSTLVYSQTFMQNISQPQSSQLTEGWEAAVLSEQLHVQCSPLPLLMWQYLSLINVKIRNLVACTMIRWLLDINYYNYNLSLFHKIQLQFEKQGHKPGYRLSIIKTKAPTPHWNQSMKITKSQSRDKSASSIVSKQYK